MVSITFFLTLQLSCFFSHRIFPILSIARSKKGPEGGADANPYPQTLIMIQTQCQETDAHFYAAAAIIFLAPISAFDQVSTVLDCFLLRAKSPSIQQR